MKRQQVTTFHELLLSLYDVQPQNTEHMQARARHIYNATLQIVDDILFPVSVLDSLPRLKNAETMTDTQIARWWGDFNDWYESLTLEQWHLLSETPVCLPN